jgi:hypothetical protein
MKLRYLLTAALAAFALVPLTAAAVDGVILIDQNKALAGSVTPGDAPGFPVTITRPGSYRLSGNLTLPASANGIAITSDGVFLDLNGFTITGLGGATNGITDENVAHSQITVRNGRITGFPSAVRLQLSDRIVVEDLFADGGPAGLAIVVGGFSRIQRNIAGSNGLIQAECPSVVTENITDGFITSFVTDVNKQCVRYHNRSINYGGSISE